MIGKQSALVKGRIMYNVVIATKKLCLGDQENILPVLLNAMVIGNGGKNGGIWLW